MKVRAIRVAEFGRFKEPVALEGLSGGLDLLIGPNEAGKSTLFRALQFALFEKHRTTQKELVRVRPYGGGGPLVEVDIEVSGDLWRIRKRYLANHAAELTSLATGSVTRGSDAEERLQQILDARGVSGGRHLLWLKQGALLSAASLDLAGKDALRAAVEREVSVAAGGETLRRVRQRVKAALGELVTAALGRPRGRYQEAIGRAADLTRELARARAAHQEAEALLDRLTGLEAERQSRVQPAMQAKLRERLAEAEEGLRRGQQGIAERETARVALADARATHQAASALAKSLGEGLAELEKLESVAHEEVNQIGALAEGIAVAEADVCAAEEVRTEARDALDAAERELKRAAAIGRWLELAGRVDRARGVSRRIFDLQERMRGLPLNEAPIREARQLAARVAESTVRLEAASAAVTVRYSAGSAARIQVDGRDVPDGERLLALTTLVLDIPGLGRVEIEPGASRDREAIETDLKRDRAALAKLLAAGAVADVEELEARHELGRSLAAEFEAARAEMNALAPEGLAELERAVSAVESEIGGDVPTERGIPDTKGLATAVDMTRERLQAAEQTVHRRVASREALKQKLIVLEARAEERQLRLAELATSLPPPAERMTKRDEVFAAAQRSSQSLDDALRLERLASSRAPDEESMKRLELEVAAARNAIQKNEREVAALVAEQARIEGALEAARREDIVLRVAELEAEAERADLARDDLAEHVQALQLLDAELGAEEERLRDSYLAPVTARLEPYLEAVFPDATLMLGGSYSAEALRRGAQVEELDRLSDGTREQIAVLVRLAFARLLADQGVAVPLVLDDALVYSDDDRIVAMHRALEMAARTHQVIVLSCREQAFRGLRANRVELVSWQPQPL